MSTSGRIARVVCSGILFLTLSVTSVHAQSAPVAEELVGLLQQASLDSVAARIPGSEDRFVAALLFGGAQLMVVSGQYPAPELLTPTLAEKSYRDVYVELQGAVVAESKMFVTDLGADGLVSRPTDEQPFDTYEEAGARTSFNGNWDDQDLSEDEYMARYSAADEQYAAALAALVAELK